MRRIDAGAVDDGAVDLDVGQIALDSLRVDDADDVDVATNIVVASFLSVIGLRAERSWTSAVPAARCAQ